MTAADARSSWVRIRDVAAQEARAGKDPNVVQQRLAELYRALSPEDRSGVEDLILEDLMSPDEARRFDSVALVREFRIRAAVKTLVHLAEVLEEGSSPGAAYEWAKVNRLIADLADEEGGSE